MRLPRFEPGIPMAKRYNALDHSATMNNLFFFLLQNHFLFALMLNYIKQSKQGILKLCFPQRFADPDFL
jgi:hypothetical protein